MKFLICIILTFAFLKTATADFPKLGQSCEENIDCRANWELCSSETKICVHKPLFNMLKLDYIGSLFTMGSIAFANTAGIGGGGIMIPTCLAFFGMDTKNAIALSNMSIFISGIIRYVYNRNVINP